MDMDVMKGKAKAGNHLLFGRISSGFTLIELMIAVAIVGILAAIAFPAYQSQVESTRRTTAQADLLELSQWMERRYSNGFDYRDTSVSPAVNPTLPFTQSPRDGDTAFYTISFSGDVDRNAYVLQAAPTGGQIGDDCGTLTLDETGAKSADEANCW
jgi:type IV pilus assembly protein PilE